MRVWLGVGGWRRHPGDSPRGGRIGHVVVMIVGNCWGPHHRVGLTGSCLAVHKYGAIVAINHIPYYRSPNIIVHLLLGASLVEDFGKCE